MLDGILDATLGLLAERGYDFSVDDVAAAAGVHKTTIYRRWPTKAALVAGASAKLAEVAVPERRSDDAVADLTALAVDVARALRSDTGSGALRALLAAAADEPDLVPTARAYLTGRYEVAVARIRDAAAEGLLRDDCPPTLVWETMVNPLHMRALLGTPADDATAAALVRLVLDGVAVTVPAGSAS